MQSTTFSALQWLAPCAPIDEAIASFFHDNASPALTSAMEVVSVPGSALALGLFLPMLLILLAFRKSWISFVAVFLTAPGMLCTELLKVVLQRPRPFPGIESGYSFPSGHTTGVAILYGMLLLLLLPKLKSAQHRAMAWAATILFILLVGFSRIALTAHYLTDVLAALALSTLWLAAIVLVTRRLRGMASEAAQPRQEVPAVAV